MPLYRIEIPIQNDYDDDKPFYKNIFFEGESCPTQEELCELLRRLDDEDKEFLGSTREYFAALQSVLTVLSFPFLAGNVVASNSFVSGAFVFSAYPSNSERRQQSYPLSISIVTIHRRNV